MSGPMAKRYNGIARIAYTRSDEAFNAMFLSHQNLVLVHVHAKVVLVHRDDGHLQEPRGEQGSNQILAFELEEPPLNATTVRFADMIQKNYGEAC